MKKLNYSNTIEFTGPFRESLLKEFCRRNDLIGICNIEEMFNAGLVKSRGRTYLGTCPWCEQEAAFSLQSHTGVFNCAHCGAAGDYLDMLCLFFDSDLTLSVNFLFECITDDKHKQAEKRKAGRAIRRQLTGGLA